MASLRNASDIQTFPGTLETTGKVRKCEPAAAFTLVELLVVVAIIGILAALLFGGSRKFIESSQSAACMSNLRQIGVAAHMYMDEHNKIIPIDDSSGAKSWQYLIAPYLGVDPETATRMDVLCCPGDPAHPPQPRTYRWNASRNKPYGVGSKTLSQMKDPRFWVITHPSKHAMIFDIAYTGAARFELWKNNNNNWGAYYDLNTYIPPDNVGAYPRPHHDNKAVNILFYDGHVGVERYPLSYATYYRDDPPD